MTQTSRFWNGLATGDATASPYDADTEFAQVIAALAGLSGRANRYGVVPQGYYQVAGTNLLVSGTSSPVSVGAGEAFVAGTWYGNTGAVTQAIATPGSSTRYDVVGLRKDWSAQTVRIFYTAGLEGNTEADALALLVQNYGTTWEAPLAIVKITTGGVITVIDKREFFGGSGILYDYTLVEDTPAPLTIDLTALLLATARYDFLELIIVGRTDEASGSGSNLYLTFNGSATGYNFQSQGENNLAVFDTHTHGTTSIALGALPNATYGANCYGMVIYRINNISGVYKSVIANSQWNDSASDVWGQENGSGMWNSTSRITSIAIDLSTSDNFVTGTRVLVRGLPG